MERTDFDYFTRRERDERANAARAEDQMARRIHLELAERYAERLRVLNRPPVAA